MGGILADVGLHLQHTLSVKPLTLSSKDMGLGKTLSVLALICSSLDVYANVGGLDQNQGCRRTLIVAPKSSRLTQESTILLIH